VGYDVTAISAHAYARCAGMYRMTSCGGSFGEGYGPKVVVRARAGDRSLDALRGKHVAVPGVNTTAFLVLSLMLGARTFDAIEMPFAEIPGAVANGEVAAGVLIHEAQLLLEQYDLTPLADLGAWWDEHAATPLPLGLNVVRRDLEERLGPGACERVTRVLARSIRHCREHAGESRAFLRARAGERGEWADDGLVERYLAMYVSDLTVEMGERGRGGGVAAAGGGGGGGAVPRSGRDRRCRPRMSVRRGALTESLYSGRTWGSRVLRTLNAQ